MGANGTIADPVAAAASLPPPDSVSLWGLISGSGPSDDGENPVHTELLIGDVYFEGDLKLMTGNSIGNALWMSPFYPNKTTDFAAQGKLACNCSESTGCLWDVANDVGEHVDLAAERPADAQRMLARRAQLLRENTYKPKRGQGTDPRGCAQIDANGGFWGPWVP